MKSTRLPSPRSPRSPRAGARSPRLVTRGRLFDRHSGTGLRGTPKRNGAGAKGAWGTIMDQEGPAYVDRNDPNYDSEEEDFVLEELQLSRPTAAAAAAAAAAAPVAAAPAEPAPDTASSSGDSSEPRHHPQPKEPSAAPAEPQP